MTALDCRANDKDIDCRKCDYYIRKNKPAYCDFRGILRDALALLKEQGKSGCDGCIYKGSDNCPLDMTDERNFICPNGKLNIT